MEMTRADIESSRTRRSMRRDTEKLKKLMGENQRNYSDIHTHPGRIGDRGVLPSSEDFQSLLGCKNIKTSWIAQTNQRTGAVEGYLVLRKTKKTQEILDKIKETLHGDFSDEDSKDSFVALRETYRAYNDPQANLSKADSPNIQSRKVMKILEDRFQLKHKFLPTKGYRLNRRGIYFEKKPKAYEGSLAGIVTSIFFVISGIFLMPTNLTGHTIASNSIKHSSFLGGLFLIIGIFLGYIYLKKKV